VSEPNVSRQSSSRRSGTKLVYDDGMVTLYHADCMAPDHAAEDYLLGLVGDVDAVITDPPYGDTALAWDRTPDPAWLGVAGQVTRQLWCFGSLRFHMEQAPHFKAEGWRYGQEIVWEKHNGSGFHADRFKRVHELAVHWYRGDWASLYKDVPLTQVYGGERGKVLPRSADRTQHTGSIGEHVYEYTEERIQRSVIAVRSEHGRAVHPTQKPLGILRPLIQFSVPAGGVVLDPFAGSGSTLVAARDMGRRAIGIEVREEYIEAAIQRLAQGTLIGTAEEAVA
jgi:site-specific DNA-methyltransferase (adenine-specific)